MSTKYSVEFYLTNLPDSVPIFKEYHSLAKHGSMLAIPEGSGPCAWVKAEISEIHSDGTHEFIGTHRRKESVAYLEWPI